MEYLRDRFGEHVFMMICRMVHDIKIHELKNEYDLKIHRLGDLYSRIPIYFRVAVPLKYFINWRERMMSRECINKIFQKRTYDDRPLTPKRYAYSSGLNDPLGYKDL